MTAPRQWAFLSLCVLGLSLSGCAPYWAPNGGEDASRLPPGRTLVLGRASSEENRPTADLAAERLAALLEEGGRIVRPRELLAEVQGLSVESWARGLLWRVERGGWPTPAEAGILRSSLDVATLLVTEVTEYEQIWGKYGKFTRVAVVAEARDLGSTDSLWRLRGESEVEDMRGRSFQYSMEQAVEELSRAIRPRLEVSLLKAWRYWRR
jgi:hypothetical protein